MDRGRRQHISAVAARINAPPDLAGGIADPIVVTKPEITVPPVPCDRLDGRREGSEFILQLAQAGLALTRLEALCGHVLEFSGHDHRPNVSSGDDCGPRACLSRLRDP